MPDPPQRDDDQIGNARYRDLVHSLTDAVFVLERDTGVVRYASPSVETVFGHRAEDLVGTDPFLLIHPEDRDSQRQNFLLIRRVAGVPPATIFRFADAAGAWRTVETVGGNSPDPSEVVVAMRDITRRDKAERALASTEQRFRTLARQAPVGIFEMDLDGRFVFTNERLLALTGVTADEDLAEVWPSLMHPDDRESMLSEWLRALAEPRRYEVQVRLVHRDGSERRVLCRVDPVYDADGALAGWIGTAEDITDLYDAVHAAERQAELLADTNRELRASQAAAAQANRAKSEFLSRMSHELRTPLNSIIGFAQLLERGDLGPGDTQEAVALIHSSGKHLLSLVEEVLDISRIETGGMSLSLEPVEVGPLVDDAVRVLRPEGTAHDVSLLIDGEEDGEPLSVRADRQRLLQVLLNLLSNAIKYNQAGGWVAVRYRAEAATVHLSVRDSGRGIAPEHLDRLFDPFERLDAARLGVSGTGLGLTVSKALLEQMGGTLTVESDVGHGTSFTVSLPRAVIDDHPVTGRVPDARPLAAGGEAPSQPTPDGPPLTVLYIEDNPANFRLVERCLQARPNVRVIGAPDGRSGLAAARDVHPDLVLLDLHLPDLSGFDVLADLRADPGTADVPVTVLTADATPGLRDALAGDGRTGYLTKPLQLADLLALVDGTTVGG